MIKYIGYNIRYSGRNQDAIEIQYSMFQFINGLNLELLFLFGPFLYWNQMISKRFTSLIWALISMTNFQPIKWNCHNFSSLYFITVIVTWITSFKKQGYDHNDCWPLPIYKTAKYRSLLWRHIWFILFHYFINKNSGHFVS